MYRLGEIALQSWQFLKTPKFVVQGKFIWFVELYISGSTNPRKLAILEVETALGKY